MRANHCLKGKRARADSGGNGGETSKLDKDEQVAALRRQLRLQMEIAEGGDQFLIAAAQTIHNSSEQPAVLWNQLLDGANPQDLTRLMTTISGGNVQHKFDAVAKCLFKPVHAVFNDKRAKMESAIIAMTKVLRLMGQMLR
jgi:hypothetical protein